MDTDTTSILAPIVKALNASTTAERAAASQEAAAALAAALELRDPKKAGGFSCP